MYIRRNMSTNVSFHELKEYHLFKQLTKVNDQMILKEVLPLVVKKVTLDLDKQYHTKNNFIYIPQEQYQTTEQGSNIEQLKAKKNRLNSKMKFFLIESKIYNILKFVFHKKIECMENMKNLEKLNFFYRSNLDQIPFGSYIYRKNDQITHIYYLVKGQIQISKSIDEKQIKITNLYQGTFFGIYEFDKSKTKRVLNACSSSNETIVVSINLDLLTQLFGKNQNQVIQKLLALNSQSLKIKSQEDKKSSFETYKIKKTNFIKAHDFQRRLMKFTEQHKTAKKDPVFAKYIENKSLLYKIKDSNNSFPKEQKENSNIFAGSHNNQSSTKYLKRLNKHRMTTLGPFFQNSQGNINKKERFSRQVDILSSRLKKRFNQSKRNFSMTGFDMKLNQRQSQLF